MLDFELIKKSLSGLFSQEHIFLYRLTDSTNTRALEYARSGGGCPAVFIAEEQTGGRGRRGRSFVSNPESGIFITFLLSPDNLCGIEGATAFAAVALREALPEAVRRVSGIKWVNDIYSRLPDGEYRKLSGILAEAVTENGKISKIVIGMGINVYKKAISDEISNIATSIEEVTGERYPREDIIASLCRSILTPRDGELILSRYREHSLTVGKRVKVIPHGEDSYRAVAVEILDDYSLLVEKDGGERVRVFSGEVSTKF